MSSNWNFRAILGVNPESDSFTCVSVKQDNTPCCRNARPLLSDMDLSEAGTILDVMDHCESLKTSFGYLDELARHTLCVIHSEREDDQVRAICGVWQRKIMEHMKTEVEVDAPIRPQTRRSSGRRGASFSAVVMTPVREEKEEQSPTTPKSARAAAAWKLAVARHSSNASASSRPTKTMSRKISSLITEVGFQDATNKQFSPASEAPPAPTRAPPIPPARKLPVRSKTQYPPPIKTSSDEWASYPLLSLLSRSSTLLKSNDEIQAEAMEIMTKQALASRSRRNTASSTGSSTTSGGKSSSSASDAGSSAPTSRSSSPTLDAKDDNETKAFPPLVIPAPMISSQPLSSSPKEDKLPTFDFGIYQSLPLPPGHKQSISNGSTPVSAKKTWADEASSATVTVPPRSWELDPSRPSFALKSLEKPSSMKNTTEPENKMGSIPIANDSGEVDAEELEESPVLGTELQRVDARTSDQDHLQLPVNELAKLPESDRMSMISTSWLNSPRFGLSRASSVNSPRLGLSRSSSVMSSVTPSQKPLLSRSLSSSKKPARTASFSLSRSLSRKLSRRSSTKSAQSDEEPISRSNSPRPSLLRRATSSARKEDHVPLNRLIQRSHELARHLDGEGGDSHGYVHVIQPTTTTYKYQLPSARRRSIIREPELRFSKLFVGLSSDMNSFPYASASFPFSVPRKPIADSDRSGIDKRSKSLGNVERPREVDVFVRPAMVGLPPNPRATVRKNVPEPRTGLPPSPRPTQQKGFIPERKIAPNPDSLLQVPPQHQYIQRKQTRRPPVPQVPQLRLFPAPPQTKGQQSIGAPPTPQTKLGQQLMGPPPPVSDVEVCANCGNVQTIWGRCDCGTPGKARGTAGSRPVHTVPVRMERRPTQRPKRGTTLRRIRKRVARAFTIS